MAANKTVRVTSFQQLDFKSLTITLLGTNNNTMSGTVNLSAYAGSVAADDEEGNYDASGAAYYVCAVILVYGLSIVSLIGSLAKKKMKDNKFEQDEVQIHKYLHKIPDLKEKSSRDNYRQLKRNVIKLVEEKTTPSLENSLNEQGFRYPNRHPDKDGSRSSLDKRPPTPHHHGKGKGKGLHKAVPPENQFLLAGVEEDEEDKLLPHHEHESTRPKTVEPHGPSTPVTDSLSSKGPIPFERLQSIDSSHFDPEEKITVVQTLPSSRSDPGDLRLGPNQPNVLMRGAEGRAPDTTPTYRWSIGPDGNIWIMQVDEKGHEKLAAPPKVDSLPPPPSPEYKPPRHSKRHPNQPVAGTSSWEPSVAYEDERQGYPRRPQGHEPSPPQYTRPSAPTSGEGHDHNVAPPLRDRPSLTRQNGQIDPPRPRYSPPPSPQPPLNRRSSIPQGDPVGQRVMALHPGAAERLATTGQPFSPPDSFQPQPSTASQPQGILRSGSRSPSDSPTRSSSPHDLDHPSVTFTRGSSLSPPLPRYGARLSPRLSGPGSRDRSRSPKPGSRHSSPQSGGRKQGGKRYPNGQGSDDDEELMQVTCV